MFRRIEIRQAETSDGGQYVVLECDQYVCVSVSTGILRSLFAGLTNEQFEDVVRLFLSMFREER